MLVKVAPRVNQMEAFEKCVEDFNGRTQIIEDGCCIVEMTDTPRHIKRKTLKRRGLVYLYVKGMRRLLKRERWISCLIVIISLL